MSADVAFMSLTWAVEELGPGHPTSVAAFGGWAESAGLAVDARGSILLALAATGRVVAALATRPKDGATMRDVAWAIVRDSRGMTESGHGAVVRWARAGLGLDEPDDQPRGAPRATTPCCTCAAAPSGAFDDGSPSYRCSHPPVRR